MVQQKDAKLEEIANEKLIKAQTKFTPKHRPVPLKDDEIPIWYYKTPEGDWEQFHSSVSRRVCELEIHYD